MTAYTYKQQTWSKLPGEFRGVRPMTEHRFVDLGKYEGAKEGYGQSEWWYRCWEMAGV